MSKESGEDARIEKEKTLPADLSRFQIRLACHSLVFICSRFSLEGIVRIILVAQQVFS